MAENRQQLLPTPKRRNTKIDKEKQCENKELDQASKKTKINIGVSFQSWRELQLWNDT